MTNSPPVTLGSVRFEADVTDDSGVLWLCEDLAGWAEPPGTTQDPAKRPLDHGGWFSDSWYLPRLLTLGAVIDAPDPGALQAALHSLRSQLAASVRASVTLLVEELDGTRSLAVRASQTVPGVSYLGDRAVRLAVELVAAWPIKAGASRSASAAGNTPGVGRTYPRGGPNPWWTYGPSGSTGDMSPVNAGNAPVHPVWVINGPVTNPRIISPDQGRTLSFAITLAVGDVLAADTDTRTVVLNQLGNRRYVLTPDSAWFDLLPGQNNVQFRSSSNTGSVTVYYSDGWW